MKRLTTDEFIAKAKATHGNLYDYSKTVYVNQTTDVIIICHIHGEFSQRPNNHYMGAGCPHCSGNARMDTASFIEKAKQVHGDEYDYSQVEYAGNNKKKVKIICSKHGLFEQTPDQHLRGHGCVLCVNEKLEETNMQKYGVARPLQNKAIYEKSIQTFKDRHGDYHVGHTPEQDEKRRATCIEHYGVDCSIKSPEVYDKIVATNQERYGGPSPFSSESIRNKASKSIQHKYNVDNIAKLQDIQRQISATKRENNTFHTSKPEDLLYEFLCDVFGMDDIERQYTSELYPFACDFYIKSRDMYIELNASWTHGGHWFDSMSDSDLKVVSTWQNRDTAYYENAIRTWTECDTKKRNVAKDNNLNYLVFWSIKLSDVMVWAAMNYPDGKDWSKMYSWLPDRQLCVPKPEDVLRASSYSKYTKYYQQNVVFNKELLLWNENPYYKNMTLQMFLYSNRLKYIGKSPDELSDLDIIRGFTISGVLKGYTIFDTQLFDCVVQKYDIQSIYDPCAGWGERLLYCFKYNIDYHGVDINSDLSCGYDIMSNDFGIENQHVVIGDASKIDVSNINAQAVITCPPYGNIEIYSDQGAENLSESVFLEWWDAVVLNSLDTNIQYFCFQINQQYKESMSDIVISHGFELIDVFEFSNHKSSHFTRRGNSDNKKEYETMLVFRKM